MKPSAIALGTFDGVHKGHRAVLGEASNSGFTSVAVVFRVPPKAFFSDTGIILTEETQKTALIKETGIEKIDYIDFPMVKDIPPEEFFDSLVKKHNPKLLVCGYNYTFGKGGKGDTALLSKLCKQKNIDLRVIDEVSVDGKPVSSSRIRQLLMDGKTKEAICLLQDGFCITAPVLHGDKRGRTIDFPTFNQCYPEKKAQVKYGVYLTKTVIDGIPYFGMTNIGVRPTYPINTPLCETYLFGFSGDLYGRTISLYLLDFIREEKKFSSLDELKRAIEKDKEKILNIINKK